MSGQKLRSALTLSIFLTVRSKTEVHFNLIRFCQCQIKNCDACSKLLDADGKIKLPDPENNEVDENTDAAVLKRQVSLMSLHSRTESVSVCVCLQFIIAFLLFLSYGVLSQHEPIRPSFYSECESGKPVQILQYLNDLFLFCLSANIALLVRLSSALLA